MLHLLLDMNFILNNTQSINKQEHVARNTSATLYACGQSDPVTISSPHDVLTVALITDNYVSAKGFRAVYKAVEIGLYIDSTEPHFKSFLILKYEYNKKVTT